MDSKLIARNTIFLYFRMFLTLVVGLYASRVVLNVLGISDYGVYNVVGGLVNSLAFLNVGMMGATQRFISFELGKNETSRFYVVFSTSVITHVIIALIIVILLESFGVWFLNYKMIIEADRMYAANWVLQFSIFTFVLSVLTVPFNSSIIAHEHMNVYAYISIAEAVLKLLIVICLLYLPVDHLILYSFLLMCVQLLISMSYIIYARKHFPECHFRYYIDKVLLKQMFSFAGWGMIGNTGFTLKDQGSNIIMNLFLGTTVNAARGIATTVNNIILSFASNVSMAMNPQITKSYAAGNIEDSLKIVYSGARLTFFLMSLIAIPFLINSDYILHLWLGIVPEYTNEFVFIILIGSLFYTTAQTVASEIHATGNVKWLQISLAVILLSELPVAYFILRSGGSPVAALLPSLITIPLSVLARSIILKKYVSLFSLRKYLLGCVGRCIAVFIICISACYYLRSLFVDDTIWTVLITTSLSLVINGTLIFCLGITKQERCLIIDRISHIVKRNDGINE